MSISSPILPDDLRHYIDTVGYNESDLLKQNRKETKELGSISIMQVGASQGALLSILCKISNFQKCLEVGVFTGYSSLCIGTSISEKSKLIVIDNSHEYLEVAKKYWRLAKIDKKIELIQDEALNALNQLKMKNEDKFDFAFIDADKANYCKYYDLIISMMKNGGIICIDNTLWKGKVYDNNDKSKSTQSIRDLNEKIKTDKELNTACSQFMMA